VTTAWWYAFLEVADRVKERIWHKTQIGKERIDGILEITLQVNNLEEVERWVLGWGEHVQEIAPSDISARIRAVADCVRSLYSR
jgi:predicted DNA-binding transcriptional regulator YafY